METAAQTGPSEPEGASWSRLALLFVLGAGLAMSCIALPGLLAPMSGATFAARCAIAAGAFLSVRLGSRHFGAVGSAVPLLCGALSLAVLPWLAPLLQPLGSLASGFQRPWVVFLLRAIFSLPVLIVPGVCAGAALRRLESRPAGLRLEALQMAILCAGGAFGSVVAGFQLLPWKGETAISLTASLALFATAVLWGLAGGGTQILQGEAGIEWERGGKP